MQPIQQLMPAALAEQLRSGPLSQAKVEFAWRTAVGAAMGRATSVFLEGQTLLVEAPAGEWGREVMRARAEILPRLARLLGAGVISTIAVRGLEEPRRRRSGKPRSGTPPTSTTPLF